MPVLDEELRNILEWRQLRDQPRLKEVWKESYTNKLGRLYQCVVIGKDGPRKQQVTDYDTFFVTKRKKIPVEQRK